MRALALSLVAGCAFPTQGGEAARVDAGPGTEDASIGVDSSPVRPAASPIAHLDVTDAIFPVSSTWDVAEDLRIQTKGCEVFAYGNLGLLEKIEPAGKFATRVVMQAGGGPDLCVLDVGTLRVTDDAEIRVVGALPLVIAAGGDVEIASGSIIDASARREFSLVPFSEPGPGGWPSGMGAGAGTPGIAVGAYGDGGGSGGGFGLAGGAGGAGVDGSAQGLSSAGGAASADVNLAVLIGGAGGGRSSPNCGVEDGGAGGGAIQITARGTLEIRGDISVGGGGGLGGRGGPDFTDCASNAPSGTGGGSGGAIYLQAAELIGNGDLRAHGGGGGGGAAFDDGIVFDDIIDGAPGDDAVVMAGDAHGGDGAPDDEYPGGDGGDGGRTAAGKPGKVEHNGGGGGGGPGIIVFEVVDLSNSMVEASPPAREI